MLVTGAALAGVSAVLAYSGVSTERFTLPADRDERQQDTPGTDEPGTAATASLAGTPALTRPRMAGAAGVAVAVLGVSMLIRRRRRAASSGQEI